MISPVSCCGAQKIKKKDENVPNNGLFLLIKINKQTTKEQNNVFAMAHTFMS
jgi:hypothetical protein